MSKLNWYINRLSAMNPKEILWRIDQKLLEYNEMRKYCKQKYPVCNTLFYPTLSELKFNENGLGINFNNKVYSNNTIIHLLAGYDYNEYKKKWHSGFQTNNDWPLIPSYKLSYKQCDRIGDARTNWELNRHFQFTLLAKTFYTTDDAAYLQELEELWTDWNKSNPFLWGISWTSVMEIAIRSISWMVTLSFLKKSGVEDKEFLVKLETGIKSMVGYVEKHYSRFSSANNHLIVEATAIGLAGFCFDYEHWKKLSFDILNRELFLQNYSDGVNKELSLHYHTFVMEAYLLMCNCMKVNGKDIPETWLLMIKNMSEFVSHSLYHEGIACEFGDNDEGKILDLQGGEINHYLYILQLSSLITKQRYCSFDSISETVSWLFDAKEISEIKDSPLYDNSQSRCFSTGGNSFLRNKDNTVLIGIDHAALGFGNIAAHGHADTLSFQLFAKGVQVFADPGTYIYHCDIESRNKYRETINHNTVCIENRNQSEILGAFLWGKKANCYLQDFHTDDQKDVLTAKHDGYSPIIHTRTYVWNRTESVLELKDEFSSETNWIATFLIGNKCTVASKKDCIEIYHNNNIIASLFIKSRINGFKIEDCFISGEYGIQTQSKAIRIYGNEKVLNTQIIISK